MRRATLPSDAYSGRRRFMAVVCAIVGGLAMGACHALIDRAATGGEMDRLVLWALFYAAMTLVAFVPNTVLNVTLSTMMAGNRSLIGAAAVHGTCLGAGLGLGLATPAAFSGDSGWSVGVALGAFPAGLVGGLVGGLALVGLRRLFLGGPLGAEVGALSPWPQPVVRRLVLSAITTYLLVFVVMIGGFMAFLIYVALGIS